RRIADRTTSFEPDQFHRTRRGILQPRLEAFWTCAALARVAEVIAGQPRSDVRQREMTLRAFKHGHTLPPPSRAPANGKAWIVLLRIVEEAALVQCRHEAGVVEFFRRVLPHLR